MKFGTLVFDLFDADGNKTGELRVGDGVGDGVRQEYDEETGGIKMTIPCAVGVDFGKGPDTGGEE